MNKLMKILGIFSLIYILVTFSMVAYSATSYKTETECYQAECSKYTDSNSQTQCRNSCKSKTGGTSGAVLNYEDDTAAGNGFDPGYIPGGMSVNTKVESVGKKVAGSVFYVLQIASFAGIVIAGIKYMYSSADQRADIKKSMIYVVSGMVLVFGASTVANYAQKSFSQVYDNGKSFGTISQVGSSYTWEDVNINAKCDNEKIKGRVLATNETTSGTAENYLYCSDSGKCCRLVNGSYVFQIANESLSKENREKTTTSKTKTIQINIPDPDKYTVSNNSSMGCQSWTAPKGKKKVSATITVKSDNTGTVTIANSKGLQYTLTNGKIKVVTSNCQGNHYTDVYSSNSLLYKNF